MLSGRYNQRACVQNNSQPGMAPGVPLFPDVFASAGYATALLGKWHPGANQPGLRPTDRGFETFYGYYTPFLNYDRPRLFRNEATVTETTTAPMSSLARPSASSSSTGTPFFLDVAFNAPYIQGVFGSWRGR